MYERADIELLKLKKKIKREANAIEVRSFADLTPEMVQESTRGMVERLLEDNETAYVKVAKDAKRQAEAELDKNGYKKVAKFDELNAMNSTLTGYNEVTGYLYYHEAQRKRLRIAEEINTAKHFGNRVLLIAALARFTRLWYLQTQEYMISIVDTVRKKLFEESDVKYAQWVAKKDDKTCEICKERDGKIYRLKDFPTKPHYNCRCEMRLLPQGYKPTKVEEPEEADNEDI